MAWVATIQIARRLNDGIGAKQPDHSESSGSVELKADIEVRRYVDDGGGTTVAVVMVFRDP